MSEPAREQLPPPAALESVDADVVVVGAGVAGAAAALAAAAGGRRVLVVVKGHAGDGATRWAQGGLAAALDPADSVAAHREDTLTAGAGLCDQEAVGALVAAAPGAITDLLRLGARFDRAAGAGGRLALTREGGHRHRRVVHAGGDSSGAEVSRTLLAALAASTADVWEHTVALDVLLDGRGRAGGLLVGHLDDAGRLLAVRSVHARAVVLATGGLGQAFHVTTNPAAATGGGLGLALRAGARLADVEFVQFHPTVLWQGPEARGQQVLVTEALRGEGAVLLDDAGRRFLPAVHPQAELAPRDVVAAAIHATIAAGRAAGGAAEHVWLDATGLGRAVLERRFPTVLAGCRAAGVDPVSEPIPVAPGAHYACGGVRADLDGRTDVPGLFAVGEVAATGVHGANRLASNSLTEGFVAGTRAGRLLARDLARTGDPAGPDDAGDLAVPSPPAAGVDPRTRSATAHETSRGAGVLRSRDGLEGLLTHLSRVAERPAAGPVRTLADVEAAELHLVSTVVATAALARAESRGCHRRSDAPQTRPDLARRLLLRLVDGRVVVATETHRMLDLPPQRRRVAPTTQHSASGRRGLVGGGIA